MAVTRMINIPQMMARCRDEKGTAVDDIHVSVYLAIYRPTLLASDLLEKLLNLGLNLSSVVLCIPYTVPSYSISDLPISPRNSRWPLQTLHELL